MLGYAFMGKAHTTATRRSPTCSGPRRPVPRLVAICGRNEAGVTEAARRYGYERAYTDWREMLKDDAVQVFDNGGPQQRPRRALHRRRGGGEAHHLREAPGPLRGGGEADAGGGEEGGGQARLRLQLPLRPRRVPGSAKFLEQGLLGEIYHFRARYLQEWGNSPDVSQWRYHADTAGSGALGDLGAHIIDLGRFLIGEPKSVSALTATFITERQDPDGAGARAVDVDDAFEAVEFQNGAVGTLEATRFAPAARTPTPSRSTASGGRSPSTWSG